MSWVTRLRRSWLVPLQAGVTPPVALVVLLAVLVLATGLGLRQSGGRVLPGLEEVAAPDYSAGTRAVVGVSGEFIKRDVGERVLARAFPLKPEAVTRPPTRERATPPASPTVRPKSGLFTARGSWELSLVFEPDHLAVAPGDRVRYTMRVLNVGTGEFRGYIVLQWHVPVHTSSAPACITELFPLCEPLSGYLIEPGTGLEAPLGFHPHRFGQTVTIASGASSTYDVDFRVHRVVPPGTVLENHAHLEVGGGDSGRVTAHASPVRVEERAA